MDYSLELVLKYPLIQINLTEESDIMLITGKIFVKDKDYSIVLKQQSLSDGEQEYELEKLNNNDSGRLLTEIRESLRNNKFEKIIDVLDEVCDCLQEETNKSLENHCDVYKKVIHEYSELTKFFLNLTKCKLKEDLTRISVSVSDTKSREHNVEIIVDYKSKATNVFRLSEFDLPQKDQDNFKPSENVVELFNQFLSKVDLLEPYFDLMEEFDQNATVLDPEMPKKQDAYRRIWLGDNVSTIITVDPCNIFQRPDIKFLGPDRLTDPYSVHLNENLGNWVCQESIFQEILKLLGLEEFPKKEVTSKQVNILVEYGECSICFSLRLDNKLPDIICTNRSCEKFYHNQCLHDWLISVNAKRIFNNISGNCPNCEKIISCPVLD